MKKVNAMTSSETYLSRANNQTGHAKNGRVLVAYKMLKCDSKLIRFILEINGLVGTDRHDWNVLWTNTQGKGYFYERLTAS